ncbi:MAG: hypothetical protein ACK5DV_13165, partial [Planctomycetota bacterium]
MEPYHPPLRLFASRFFLFHPFNTMHRHGMIIFNSTGIIVGRSELAMVEPIAEEVNSQTTAAPDFSPDGSKPGFGTLQQESPPKLLQGSNPVSCEPFPAQIGRYRIEKLLGSGSFGRVLLGYDGSLDRQVAIKVPHRHLL